MKLKVSKKYYVEVIKTNGLPTVWVVAARNAHHAKTRIKGVIQPGEQIGRAVRGHLANQDPVAQELRAIRIADGKAP